MMATLSRGMVVGSEWVFEEKYDGIRLLAFRDGERVRLFSRNLIDRTSSWPHLALAIGALPGGDLVLDGEVFAFDKMRVSRFQLLQQRAHPTFAAFDLPIVGGRSLMRRPLAHRREALEALLRGATTPIRISRRLRGGGERAYRTAEERQWEGIIAKRVDSTYQPGVRSPDWLKVKVRHESEFVIGGWTPPTGARSDFGALLIGLFDGARLRFTGKVGTGFTRATLATLGAKLTRLETTKPPFDPAPLLRGARWARPRLVAQIAFAEWTANGKLRQPAFLGLRTDKDPTECRWEERE